MKVTDVDVPTGKIVERDATPEELQQMEADKLAHEAEEAAKLAKAAKKEAASAKLEALGLDADDLRALGL